MSTPRERRTTLMTVRRAEAKRNTYRGKSGFARSSSPRALLTLRAAVVLSGGLVVGLATGILTYFAVHNVPDAILAGIPACATAIKFLDAVIAEGPS
jgi:hypothetical protein